MQRNIEIKARITRIEDIESRVQAISDTAPRTLEQDDTFFPAAHGRLKLRDFSDGTGELIFYRREDADGPKESSYVLAPTTSPGALRSALAQALGMHGRVRKRRLLYMIGRTRVHLDRVEELGDYLELEVVLHPDESEMSGAAEARRIMDLLGIRDDQLVSGSYLDLHTSACAAGQHGCSGAGKE